MADHQQTLVDLAAARFETINSTMGNLLTATTLGQEADAAEPGDELEASVISWLCTDPIAISKVHRHGLAMRGYRIKGDYLDLTHAVIPFPLHFHNCEFQCPIHLKNSRLLTLIFRACQLSAINADSISVEGVVAISEGSEVHGEVSLREARLGSFRSDGSVFNNAAGQALVCDRIRVSSAVFLSQANSKSTFFGEVRFSGAQVEGNFDCIGASFLNEEGVALNCERIATPGSVFIRECKVRGILNVSACRIGAALDFRQSDFMSKNEVTLNVEKAKVDAYILLDMDFTCDKVRLLAVDVGGAVRCYHSKIGSLDLRRARVAGLFEWTEMKDPLNSELDLRDATFGSIMDDEASWPRAGALFLKGMRFDGFSDCTEDVKTRLAWLRLDSSQSAQAYHQLSQVYAQHGRPDLGRKVLFELEAVRRSHVAGLFSKIWNGLLRCTIGYGYKLWRAALIMALITVCGAFVAALGYRTKLIAPNDKDANAAFVQRGAAPTNYPRFSSTIFSIEHSLPGMNLGISSAWSSDTDAKWPAHSWVESLIRCWFWGQTVFGWVLSIFFIAGVSGIIKAPK